MKSSERKFNKEYLHLLELFEKNSKNFWLDRWKLFWKPSQNCSQNISKSLIHYSFQKPENVSKKSQKILLKDDWTLDTHFTFVWPKGSPDLWSAFLINLPKLFDKKSKKKSILVFSSLKKTFSQDVLQKRRMHVWQSYRSVSLKIWKRLQTWNLQEKNFPRKCFPTHFICSFDNRAVNFSAQNPKTFFPN